MERRNQSQLRLSQGNSPVGGGRKELSRQEKKLTDRREEGTWADSEGTWVVTDGRMTARGRGSDSVEGKGQKEEYLN